MILISDEELKDFCINLLYESGASENYVKYFCTVVDYTAWDDSDYRNEIAKKVRDEYGEPLWIKLEKKYQELKFKQKRYIYLNDMLVHGREKLGEKEYQDFLIAVVENLDDTSFVALALSVITDKDYLEFVAISNESESIRTKAYNRLKEIGRYSINFWRVSRHRKELDL